MIQIAGSKKTMISLNFSKLGIYNEISILSLLLDLKE